MPRLSRYLLILLFVKSSAVLYAQADIERLEQDALYAAANRAAPSVVRIETVGGLEKVGSLLVNTGPTSGVVVGEEGFIVSSAFSFIQEPTSILVTLPSGTRHAAKIVSRHHSRMLVLLKIDADELLQVPTVTPLSEVRVGQWSVTVGRTIPGAGFNVSAGIVSAKNRIWGKAVQTDANVSPANYGGALVDIEGRVIGVLVPLSPESSTVVAGAEWYDSGIGFAIPLEDVMAHLPRLKQNDLYPGKLGISLQGNDVYGAEVIVGVSRPNSPAREAGLEAGDKIRAINGSPIRRQAELKQVLGPMLSGDKVSLSIQRGDEYFEKELVLTDRLKPYEHAFMGILPQRTQGADSTPGVVVRYVYSESPAALAGLQANDRIVSLADEIVPDAASLRQTLAGLEPGDEVTISRERDGASTQITLQLDKMPTAVPAELPGVFPTDEQSNEDLPQIGKVNIKLPEEAGECQAYIPETYDPRFPQGLVVLLPIPGKDNIADLIANWRAHCDASRTLLLLPQAKNSRSWLRTETAFVRKTIENLKTTYNVDSERIVVQGTGISGSMAYLVAFTQRDLIRGVAASRRWTHPCQLARPRYSTSRSSGCPFVSRYPKNPFLLYIAFTLISPGRLRIYLGTYNP